MKHPILTAALCAFIAVPTWVQEAPAAPETGDPAFKISVDADDEEKQPAAEEAKAAIREKVLSLVEKILDKVDQELKASDKETLIENLKDLEAMDSGLESPEEVIGGLLVGALAIVLIFGMPIMIVAAILYFSYRKRRLVHETINSYVASGKEIPPEVFKSFQEQSSPTSNLHKGLVMCGVGLGIIVTFAVIGAIPAAAFGAIPLFIGLAQLLIWKLEKNGSRSGSGN